MCGTLTFLLDNIYIRFGSKLYRQIVGIPMGTYFAPLVADLFLFCYLDDLLNSDNNFFDSMVNQIYPSELQANVSDTEASFWHVHLSISDGFAMTKIYGDLVYKFRKIIGKMIFLIISRRYSQTYLCGHLCFTQPFFPDPLNQNAVQINLY